MIVTEEEAKTKRCHETFDATWGTSRPGPTMVNCIGSACMAWRWATEWVDGSRLQERTSTTHGYCGKAGKP